MKAGNTYKVSFDAASLYDANPAKLTFYASLTGPAVSVINANLSSVLGTWKNYRGSFGDPDRTDRSFYREQRDRFVW